MAEDTGFGLGEIVVRVQPGNYYAMTNEQGVYMIRGLAPGMVYVLSFFREGSPYVNEYQSMEIEIPENKSVVNIDHALRLGASISGMVVNDDGVTPMVDVAVQAYSPGHPGWIESSRMTRTDSTGRYLIQGLPESDNCRVSVAIYSHAWMERTVKVTRGKTTGAVNFLIKWDDITGIKGRVVSKKDKKPLIDTRVAIRTASGSTSGIALTDINGRYSIIGVTPGRYDVVADKYGYNFSTRDILVEQGKATAVDIEVSMPEELEEEKPAEEE